MAMTARRRPQAHRADHRRQGHSAGAGTDDAGRRRLPKIVPSSTTQIIGGAARMSSLGFCMANDGVAGEATAGDPQFRV
jgi:hypothetical protein